MSTKVNKVSAEKASANAKAIMALDVLKKVKNAGLFKTSLGQKEIYKRALFEGANEKQIKSLRKKLRNVTFNFLSSIANNAEDKNLIEGFIDFYKQVYVINDFSFSSIANENTKEEKKRAILIKGLDIVKKSMK